MSLFLIFVAHNPLTKKLKFLSNSGSEFTYIQCWCYYPHNQNDYICKSTFVRPETVSNEHFGFSLFVAHKNSEMQNLSATQQLETKIS